MRNPRKYRILSLLGSLLFLLFMFAIVRDFPRMAAAEEKLQKDYVEAGAKLYAQNCLVCHGPSGEGSVGMPLARKDLQVSKDDPNWSGQYDMIYNTILQGRPGQATPYWEKAPDGKWISYTQMPGWSASLTTDDIKALTLFIMEPNNTQWSIAANYLPKANLEPDKDTGVIPLPNSANTDVNAAAQALLRNTSKSMCLTCHAINGKGGVYGPELSNVGSWGVDQAWLENWIKYAAPPTPNATDKTPAMAHDVRMPVYWSANRATLSGELDLSNSKVSTGPYKMPRFKGFKANPADPNSPDKLSDEEISIIARYLLGLK